jgi:hypothetical protein
MCMMLGLLLSPKTSLAEPSEPEPAPLFDCIDCTGCGYWVGCAGCADPGGKARCDLTLCSCKPLPLGCSCRK